MNDIKGLNKGAVWILHKQHCTNNMCDIILEILTCFLTSVIKYDSSNIPC
jgi:hypothetical protein